MLVRSSAIPSYAVAFGATLLSHFFVAAQDFSVPSTWREPTSSLSRSDRNTLARNALGELTSRINAVNGTIYPLAFPETASLVSIIALQDLFNATALNADVARQSLQAAEQDSQDFYDPSDHLSSDKLSFGLAAYYCFRAYNDTTFLATAISIWSEILPYMVTAADAQSGTQSSRNVTFQSSCPSLASNRGGSTAGGVFQNPDILNSTLTHGDSVGALMALSAYLYEATQNITYLDVAQVTFGFAQNLLYNGEVILFNFDLQPCNSANPPVVTFSSPTTIEGLAVLANVTNNSTLATFVNNLAVSTMNVPDWAQGNSGVIKEDSPGRPGSPSKGIFIRSLRELWNRTQNGELKQLIEAYITVQLNALLDTARDPGSNSYGSPWTSQPSSTFDPAGQIAAVDLLNAAFSIAAPGGPSTADPAPVSPSGSPSESPLAHNSNGFPTSSIVGAVVGGTLGLCLFAALGAFLFRRHRQRLAVHATEIAHPDPPELIHSATIEPFLQRHVVSEAAPVSLGSTSVPSFPTRGSSKHRGVPAPVTRPEEPSATSSSASVTEDAGYDSLQVNAPELRQLLRIVRTIQQEEAQGAPPQYMI